MDEEIKIIKDKLNPLKESNEYKERSLSLLKLLEKEDRDQKTKRNRNIIEIIKVQSSLNGKKDY